MSDVQSPGLKAFIDATFDGIYLVEDLVKKSYFALFSDVAKILGDTPAVVSHLDSVKQEIADLADVALQNDLIVYIEQKFKGAVDSSKAQKLLAISLEMIQHSVVVIQDALALKSVIES